MLFVGKASVFTSRLDRVRKGVGQWEEGGGRGLPELGEGQEIDVDERPQRGQAVRHHVARRQVVH